MSMYPPAWDSFTINLLAKQLLCAFTPNNNNWSTFDNVQCIIMWTVCHILITYIHLVMCEKYGLYESYDIHPMHGGAATWCGSYTVLLCWRACVCVNCLLVSYNLITSHSDYDFILPKSADLVQCLMDVLYTRTWLHHTHLEHYHTPVVHSHHNVFSNRIKWNKKLTFGLSKFP